MELNIRDYTIIKVVLRDYTIIKVVQATFHQGDVK